MQPLPMNEYIQQNLNEVGIDVEFEVMEWNTLINVLARRAPRSEPTRGANGDQLHLLHRRTRSPPSSRLYRQRSWWRRNGTNWGYYSDPRWTR